MEIQFFDNGDQKPQPKEEIRIESLSATPYPDRFRIFVEIHVTPFLERPNLILVAINSENSIVGELNIIETMHTKMEFTLHLRGVKDPAGDYNLKAELFYTTRNPPQDQKEITFTVPSSESA